MKCNKCNGRGEIPARPYNLGDLFYYSGPMKKCPHCKGTGEYTPSGGSQSGNYRQPSSPRESMWAEKTCPGLKGGSYCGNTIKYRKDWDKIPDICPSCREKIKALKAQREAEWREKSCAGCGSTIKYNINWAKIPDLCKSCIEKKKAEWQEKRCQTAGCINTVRYNVNWDHIPNFCAKCKAEHQNNPRGRRNFIPNDNPNTDANSIPGFRSGTYPNRDDAGKVMDDTRDPNHSTHIHRHPDGTTISSFEDGNVTGRYNFNTGEDETPRKK